MSSNVWMDATDDETDGIQMFSDGSLVEWMGHYVSGWRFGHNTDYNYQYMRNDGWWAIYHHNMRLFYICEAQIGELKRKVLCYC